MASKPEILTVTPPPQFGNFTERRTRGQQRRLAVARLKFAVKWMLNWKGIRKA